MAGPAPLGFDGDAFRAGIHLAMQMGAPPEEENRAVFLFPSQLVYNAADGAVDATGVPFNPEVPVRNQPTPPVTDVPCAVEYYDERGQATNFGNVHATRVKVLLLDEDFQKVKGTNAVVLGGDKYIFRRMQPPSGLFDVGIFELWFHAEDET